MQGVEQVPARRSQRSGSIAVRIAAGGIGRAVGTVTAHREHGRVLSGQCRGCGQRQLLIAPAQPFAGQVHHRFPACDKGQLFPLPRMGVGDGPQKAARLPRLAAKPVGEEQRCIAQFPAGFGSGGAQLPHTAGDLGRHVVKGFRRFLRQQRLCLRR